jgi:hypothetical protein
MVAEQGMEKMFEYDSSHVTLSHWTKAAQLRHVIARKDYADRKAALVLKEESLRRKADRSRVITALWTVLTRQVRHVARALPKGPAANADNQR